MLTLIMLIIENQVIFSESLVHPNSIISFQVARLAKYWNFTIFYSGSQYGRSYIFKLLGIKSGQEEEQSNQDDASILRAFRLFLKRVETIDQQKVIFTDF